MVAGTLYTYPDSFRGVKCRVAAEFGGAKLKIVEVQQGDKAHHHVPSFQSDDKKVSLVEATAISYYLANDQLRGNSLEDKASVIQWLEYGTTEVTSAVASWVYPSLSLAETTPANLQRAKDDLKQVFQCINDTLKTKTYLVGERLTLADISVAADLLLAYQHVADEKFRQPFANANRWFTTIINQPQFKKVVADVKFCEKAAEFDAKKFAEQKKSGASKPAAEKKPEVAKKPEAKKPEAKKPEPADDAEEEEDYGEGQQKDPFAAMPKGTFNMDEFKRVYSNEDTATKALPYLWSHFEKEFYSLWFCEYKYPEELALTFMSSNLVGGMFQRIERLRKNAFGSMCVWGENNKNTIAGVWFWRGQDLAFPLCPDWTTDYESYNWRKMNPDDEKDRKIVNQFLMWEGDFNGQKFAVGKIFK